MTNQKMKVLSLLLPLKKRKEAESARDQEKKSTPKTRSIKKKAIIKVADTKKVKIRIKIKIRRNRKTGESTKIKIKLKTKTKKRLKKQIKKGKSLKSVDRIFNKNTNKS